MLNRQDALLCIFSLFLAKQEILVSLGYIYKILFPGSLSHLLSLKETRYKKQKAATTLPPTSLQTTIYNTYIGPVVSTAHI